MKLRIRDNSVGLRLTQDEIEGEQVLVDGDKLAIVVAKDIVACSREEEAGRG